jgi:hypothetical protein
MDLDAGSLIASMIISTVGFGLFLFGKKQQRWGHLSAGLLMMVYPYFVPGVLPMVGIGVAMVGALWFAAAKGIV